MSSVNHKEVLRELVLALAEDGIGDCTGAGYPSEYFVNQLRRFRARHPEWTFLGGGYFSLAFRHVSIPDVCYKVSLKRDDCGPAYWAYCMDHAGEGLVPDTYAMIRDPLSGVRAVAMMLFGIGSSADSYDPERICRWPGPQRGDKYYAAYHTIREWARNMGCVDMHGGNVMYMDGVPYITDPISTGRGLQTKRFDVNIHKPEPLSGLPNAGELYAKVRKQNRTASPYSPCQRMHLGSRVEIKSRKNPRWLDRIRGIREVERGKFVMLGTDHAPRGMVQPGPD